MTEIDEAIRELTGVTGAVERLDFKADIGSTDEDSVDWIFIKGSERRAVTMPRASFEYEREPGVNFWLVNMSRAAAEIHGIAHLAISETDAARHRERFMEKSW